MREQDGYTVAMPIPTVDANTLGNAINSRIDRGSTLHTDEARA